MGALIEAMPVWLKLILIVISSLAVIGAMITLLFFFPRWLVLLGDIDEWWSPVRTRPPEGEMYVLAKGTPNGPFAGVIESVATHDYDGKNHVFVPAQGGISQPPTGYLARHGVAWVGLNRYLVMRPVHYDKWEKLPNSSDWGIVGKDRTGPSIYFQYNMATEMPKVETTGNFPVSVVVTFTVQIISPLKALFFAGGWEAQVNAGVQGVIREYVGGKTIDQLREEHLKGGGQLVNLITGNTLNDELEDKFGVRIIKATFVDFDLVSGDAATTKAVQAIETARLEGEARIVSAQADETAAKHTANAITLEYEARIKAGGKHAGTFRTAEAIEAAKPKAIGAGILVSADDK